MASVAGVAAQRTRGTSARDREATPSFFESLYTNLTADANEVADGLFLGAAIAGEDYKPMLKKRITHVLIVHPTLKESHPGLFSYGRVALPDVPTANLLEQLPDALEFLGAARRRKCGVFVCCMKGISRSSSVVIALLMVERNLSFADSFQMCEGKRPVVYPNVGFQQQLLHLEKILSKLNPAASWEDRIRHIRSSVPAGNLEASTGPLRISDAIGGSLTKQIDETEVLIGKVFSQPQLLQKKELWKRHGLFFENFHKYKALPSDPKLLERAGACAQRLRSLPKTFSDTLKGVKMALAVAKEIESWAKFAEIALRGSTGGAHENKDKSTVVATAATTTAKAETVVAMPSATAADSDVPAWVLTGVLSRRSSPSSCSGSETGAPVNDRCSSTSSSSSSSSSDSSERKKKKKKGKKKKVKKKRKEKNMANRDEKRDKKRRKAEKAAQKAGKLAADVERAALRAEEAAKESCREAELAAERAKAVEEEVAAAEAAEAAKRRGRGGGFARRGIEAGDEQRSRRRTENGRSPRARSGSGSSSPSRCRNSVRGPPVRLPAMEAYADLS
eukprot:TRINITY_DN16112_c0_g2_i1.p1 TRINITY_DN16112_c0_g2~~TRINITY_DN16112_c0_g2_i1.p1  ORF type:complete len:562 (+),score=124.48 TRINITY_DN16112_c0_g2_i1:205-1890(+)